MNYRKGKAVKRKILLLVLITNLFVCKISSDEMIENTASVSKTTYKCLNAIRNCNKKIFKKTIACVLNTKNYCYKKMQKNSFFFYNNR
jgi:hypothetical protein